MRCPGIIKEAISLGKYFPKRVTPYHFESSDRHIDDTKIHKAIKSIRTSQKWSKRDMSQLDAITKMERLRSGLSRKAIPLADYKKKIKNIDVKFYKKYNMDIFEETPIHDSFYHKVNEEG